MTYRNMKLYEFIEKIESVESELFEYIQETDDSEILETIDLLNSALKILQNAIKKAAHI